MTAAERLQTFVEGGCAISIGSTVFFPAVAEIVGKKLFWVCQFPQDQHHAHAEQFDTVEQPHALGVSFFRDGQLFAHVAPLAEWPELDDRAADKWMRWVEHLSDDENQEMFERFVALERELRT